MCPVIDWMNPGYSPHLTQNLLAGLKLPAAVTGYILQ